MASETRSLPETRASWLLWLAAGVAIAALAFNLALFATSPAPADSGVHARSKTLRAAITIAQAIATPPQPVPQWAAFLHPWQSADAATLALEAALIGAWALMKQAEASRLASREQIAAAAQLDRIRYEREDTREIDAREKRRGAVAGALAAEIRSWHNRLGNARCFEILADRLRVAQGGLPPTIPAFPVLAATFPIYEKLCGDLGTFLPEDAVTVVETYAAIRSIAEFFESVRRGDYAFLDEPNTGTPTQVAHKANEKAGRAANGLQSVILDLQIFDGTAWIATTRLGAVAGTTMPELPTWPGLERDRDLMRSLRQGPEADTASVGHGEGEMPGQ